MKMAQAVVLLVFFFPSPTSTTLLHHKTTASTTVLDHPHSKTATSTSALDHKTDTSTAALDHRHAKTATSTASLDHPHAKTSTGFQVPLKRHFDFVENLTKSELLLQSINLAKQRRQTMDSPIIVETPITAGNGNFLVELSIGTPPKAISAVIDTTRDLIWTPCRQPYEQPPCSTPTIFDPSNSTTYSKLSCSSELCNAFPIPICLGSDCLYVDTFSQGSMATDTLTFGYNVSISKVGFGCAEGNHQGVGIVGLGRGPLSLVSQLGATFFSYCIPPYESSESGSLFFTAAPPQHLLLSRFSSLITTPLITNPLHPSLYYLTVEGISIGHQLLPIKKSNFQVKPDGSGGVIIDSGSPVTFLEDKAFQLVKKEFTEQVKLPTVDESLIGFEACYALPPSPEINVPQFVLHFGGGADLILPTNNFFVTFTTPDLMIGCLAMLPSHIDGMSIIGNFQTQNIVVLHDLLGQRLSFLPTTSCMS